MVDSIARVEELRVLLGMTQARFLEPFGMKGPAYSNWKTGPQVPGPEALREMADRWMVSDDSLRGRSGTAGLEPSPELRAAQQALLTIAARQDTPGTSTTRLVQIYRWLTEPVLARGAALLPCLTLDVWLEWIQSDLDKWTASIHEPNFRKAGEQHLRGAAMLAGWYELRQPWRLWLEDGLRCNLEPAHTTLVQATADLMSRSDVDSPLIREFILKRNAH